MAVILLVEDDDYFRRVVHLVLQRAGYEVHEACNGEEALRRFAQLRVDLVVTDLVMPEKEGIETITELRKRNPAVPIIAMSGGGTIGANLYLQIASRLGAKRVLAKPFQNAELLEAVQSVLMEGMNKAGPANPSPA